jgi:hypothetical protein
MRRLRFNIASLRYPEARKRMDEFVDRFDLTIFDSFSEGSVYA